MEYLGLGLGNDGLCLFLNAVGSVRRHPCKFISEDQQWVYRCDWSLPVFYWDCLSVFHRRVDFPGVDYGPEEVGSRS